MLPEGPLDQDFYGLSFYYVDQIKTSTSKKRIAMIALNPLPHL